MKNAKKQIKTIAKIFGTKIVFVNKKNFNAGEYCYIEKSIFLNLFYLKNSKELLFYFFHELGHSIDHELKFFKNYYNRRTTLPNFRKIAIHAEVHADKTGEKLFKQFYPSIRYSKAYRNKDSKKFLLYYYRDRRFKSQYNEKYEI